MKKSRSGACEIDWIGLWTCLLENSKHVTNLCVDQTLHNPAFKSLQMCSVITSTNHNGFKVKGYSALLCYLCASGLCARRKRAPGSQPVCRQFLLFHSSAAFHIINNILLSILTRLGIASWTWQWFFFWNLGRCLYQLIFSSSCIPFALRIQHLLPHQIIFPSPDSLT